MGGGLMQLVAYGAQDIYLTGKPQITFFKCVYRRYTNFAVESIPQDIQSTPQFNGRISLTVARNGDLLKKIWLEYSPYDLLSGLTSGPAPDCADGNTVVIGANIGHSIIDYIDLEIGGQLIDRHYGRWLTIWNYLTEPNTSGDQGAVDCYCTGPGEFYNGVNPVTPSNINTGNTIYQPYTTYGDNATTETLPRTTKYNRMAYTHRAQLGVKNNYGAPQSAWVPLQFWFCRNPGLAIPLIALQYHEVKLYINFAPMSSIRTGTNLSGFEFSRFAVYADFVYLDTSERRQFAQNAHEYLIDQVQVAPNVVDTNIKLAFNHPVKELIWTPISLPVGINTYQNPVTNQPPRSTVVPGGGSPSQGFTPSNALIQNLYKLVLNGTDRFSARDISYFTRNQVWEAHGGFGSVLFPDSIAVYSFALRPEEYQPSGTCNFSRIDVAQIVRTTTYGINGGSVADPDKIDIYAINFNLFRINSGMGGIAYSN